MELDKERKMILGILGPQGAQCPACGFVMERQGGDTTMMCGCEVRQHTTTLSSTQKYTAHRKQHPPACDFTAWTLSPLTLTLPNPLPCLHPLRPSPPAALSRRHWQAAAAATSSNSTPGPPSATPQA